jgi:thiamine biosynthesis lipoprotein
MTKEVYTAVRKAAALLLLAAAGCSPPSPATLRFAETRRLMGVPWTITVCTANEVTGRGAIAAGFAEVERLERVLSDYDPESELSRLSSAAPMAAATPVSRDLWRVLEQSVALRDRTGGGFDPAIGRLTTLWRQARRSERLPVAEKLHAALATVGPDALQLDATTHGVRLPKPGTRLDLGGIGMGYAADRALEAIAAAGITAAMVDASGDVAVSAAPPGSAGWRIEVAALDAGKTERSQHRESLLLAHAAVTTSGDAFQAVEIDGRRYSHIVDPRTGLGVAGPAAVTVIAPDCTTADAVATAASVLGPEQGLALVAATPGCAARFTWREATSTQTATTPAWPSHLAPASPAPPRP